MKKPRGDSTIDELAPHQKECLEQWLFEENLKYKEALERLHLDFGVRSSASALGRFYQRVLQRRLLESIGKNARQANEIESEFAKNPAPVPQAVVKLVTQLAFEHLAGGARNLDPEFVVKLVKLSVDSGLKAKKLELDERRIELLEQKAKQADQAAAAVKDDGLTAEEKQARLRQIFGMS